MAEAIEPFLKWAGGKRALLGHLARHAPPVTDIGTYYEPFLGGGAMFFGLQPFVARLSDINAELIETYEAVRDDVDAVIAALRRLRYSHDDASHYYRVRGSKPRTPYTRAARFIYLNKTCFNGLFRVNTKGEFNVPVGRHPKNHVICDEEQLRRASKALSDAVLSKADFESALATPVEGDFVYLDPPYITSASSRTVRSFAEYDSRVFSWSDQQRLAACASDLVDRGVTVVVSNADHSSIRSLYRPAKFSIHKFERASTMAGNSTHRRLTSEVVIVGRP